MGIGSEIIELLIELRLSGHLHRRMSVVEIGAQQLAPSFIDAADRLSHLGHIFGVKQPLSLPKPAAVAIVHGDLPHLEATAPAARDFWNWLGFRYASIDIDGSPGSLPLDLNFDEVPADMRGRFRLVTNFGTTEHVANQINAFKIIHDLAAPGAIIIHQVPAQGMLNHGLINYNFKFFWMLARSNGYAFLRGYFTTANTAYALPDNIREFISGGGSHAAAELATSAQYTTIDAGILAVMVKSFDIPFVPPIDVPTGVQTDIEALRKRYWTVFEPNPFEGVPVHDPCSRSILANGGS